jgi:hypothetical protein
VEIIKNIGFQTLEILILILSLVGLAISFLLLVSPNRAKSINSLFNQQITIDNKLNYLDKPVLTDSLTYRHNILFGITLITGSGFLLVFLFFQMDVPRVVSLFSDYKYVVLVDIVVKAMVLAGKIASLAGIIFGLLLLFAPEAMIKIENRMDSWFATQFVVDRLDESHHGVENLILKYPLLFGFAGLMTSLILVILSIGSLLV